MTIQQTISIEQARASGSVRYFTGKACARGHIAERYVADRSCLLCSKEVRKKNRPKELARVRQWHKDHPRRVRGHQIKYRYGITIDQYDAMISDQGGICAICGTSDPETKHGNFYVDHCHATGAVRGLLCRVCNWLVGAAKDDVYILQTAIAYLQRSRQ